MNNHLSCNAVTIRSSRFTFIFTFIALWMLAECLSLKAAYAARECYFSNAPFTTTISLSNGPEISLRPHITTNYMLSKDNLANSSWGLHSDCRTGNDGENLFGKKGSVAQISSYNMGYSYLAGLYATNIPGILYAVAIINSKGITGYIPYNSSTGEMRLWDMKNYEPYVEDTTWNFYISLYQTPQFVGIPKGVSSIHPLNQGNIGAFRLGESDSNNGLITVIMGDFSFPVKTPTCTSLVSSAGGGTIPLGDYTPLQIKSGSTKIVNFTLNTSGCTNVSMFNTRVTTNIVSPGNSMLLGNSAISNAATGIGVKITTAYGGQLKPNDANSINSVSDTNIPASKQLQFSAQLVGDSKNISVGSFSATGTFVVNYE